jgi:phage FluMu protein Com
MKAVESGITRCPRCMVLTGYKFFDRGDDTLLYEVRCESCGNVYSEVTGVPAASAA